MKLFAAAAAAAAAADDDDDAAGPGPWANFQVTARL